MTRLGLGSSKRVPPPASTILVILLLLLLLFVLFYLLFRLPEPSHFQRQVARVIVAFASGLLAYFFVGTIVIAGTAWGFRISAGAGFALFILVMFVVNPFEPPRLPKGQPAFFGETLGGLAALVDEAYAAQETTERIVLDPTQADQLYNFALEKREWTDRTWLDLAQRICSFHACLQCEKLQDPNSVRIRVRGQVEKRCLDAECLRYTFSCKP